MPSTQQSSRDPLFSARQTPSKPAAPLMPGSLDHYLAEHGTEPANHRGIILLVIILLALILFFGWYVMRKTPESVSTSTPNLIERIFGGLSSGETIPADDLDRDGLATKQEKDAGTDLSKADTDADGLTDREELSVYKTNPLSEDSDKDSISDGKEIINRTDPLNPAPNAAWPPLPPQIGVNR